MKKFLGILVLCLFWSNISLSHDLDKSKTLDLEDLLFEIGPMRDQDVHVFAFFLLDKNIGQQNSLIVDPKDPRKIFLAPSLRLKPGSYKKLYKDCETKMKTEYKKLYLNIWIPCGYFNIHLHISSSGVLDQYIKHMR